MDVNFVIRIAGIGLLVGIAYTLLNKSGRDEMAMLVSVAGTVIVFIMIVTRISELVDTVKELFGL